MIKLKQEEIEQLAAIGIKPYELVYKKFSIEQQLQLTEMSDNVVSSFCHNENISIDAAMKIMYIFWVSTADELKNCNIDYFQVYTLSENMGMEPAWDRIWCSYQISDEFDANIAARSKDPVVQEKLFNKAFEEEYDEYDNDMVFCHLAKNRNLAAGVIQDLTKMEDKEVRSNLLQNPSVSMKVKEKLKRLQLLE